jgi:hypothetical protein
MLVAVEELTVPEVVVEAVPGLELLVLVPLLQVVSAAARNC